MPYVTADLDTVLLDATIQSTPHPPNSPPIRSKSLQFRVKDVVGNCVRGLTEVQIEDIHSSCLVHWCSHSIIDGHKVGQAGLALGEVTVAVSNHFPVLHVL